MGDPPGGSEATGGLPLRRMDASPHGSAARNAVCHSGKEGIVNYQSEPAEPRPERSRPGGVYIGAGAIVAIAIIVLLIILIF